MRLHELIKEYWEFQKLETKEITAKRYLSDINLLMLYLRNPELKDIKDRDVLEYLNLMIELGWEYNSVVKKSKSLKSFWKWLNKKYYVTFSHELIPNMRMQFKFPYVTSEEDYRRVLKMLPKNHKSFPYNRNKAIIQLLWDTGARNGEICSLNIEDINLEELKAVVRTEKSRGQKPFREIYWTEETNETLKKWIIERNNYQKVQPFVDPQALFISINNQRRGLRLRNVGLGIMLKECARRAKIPRFNAHGMRHHMGHLLNEKGANNSQISSILGHAQLSSSFIYTELNNKEREKAYNKFLRKKK